MGGVGYSRGSLSTSLEANATAETTVETAVVTALTHASAAGIAVLVRCIGVIDSDVWEAN